jgi:phage tail protein X
VTVSYGRNPVFKEAVLDAGTGKPVGAGFGPTDALAISRPDPPPAPSASAANAALEAR